MHHLDQKILESWEQNASAWEKSIREERIASRNLVTNGAILRVVRDCRPSRVLDAGCGEGWLSRMLSAEGIDSIGFDGSAALIEAAKNEGSGQFKVLSYDQFMAAPEQVGSNFDVVVFNFALLSANIAPVLKAAAAVLNEGGVVIVQTLHPFHVPEGKSYASEWCEEHFSGMGEGYRAAMPWFFRTFGDWLAVVQDAGLTIKKIEEPLHPDTGRPASLILVLSR